MKHKFMEFRINIHIDNTILADYLVTLSKDLLTQSSTDKSDTVSDDSACYGPIRPLAKILELQQGNCI